jgi:hypothetical protein
MHIPDDNDNFPVYKNHFWHPDSIVMKGDLQIFLRYQGASFCSLELDIEWGYKCMT